MLVPIDQMFIFDDSNLNGLKQWEDNQYDLDNFDPNTYNDNGNENKDPAVIKAIQDHNAALQMIEGGDEMQEFMDEFSKRDLSYR